MSKKDFYIKYGRILEKCENIKKRIDKLLYSLSQF